ncbi:efflux RND transporter periplasmic adaptor subunit [Fodinicurvata sediminis]|uniref:efflux RND transporter periplasmic adaptor subunit n=1 Tax=Fodinicurvata sediminis TaxID=1121832 RepID=UPI0003B308FA|nr:efflux RND transporter periplasmic adaptor subunit [Fodinicurvata sediminis]
MIRTVFQILFILLLAGGGYYAWQSFSPGDPGGAGGGPPGGGEASPVVVSDVRIGLVAERVEAVGTAEARESIEVVPEVAGRIETIHFEQGQEVAAEDILLELDSTRQQALLREAEANQRDMARQLERARQLLSSQNVPQARVDELQAGLEAASARAAAIETDIADRKIRAPFEGVVGLRRVSPGAYIDSQTIVTTLDDLSEIKMEFSVPERFMGVLSRGLPVEATSAAWPGETFEGVVSDVDTRVDPATRSLRVEATLPNEDRRLRPGMFMAVRLLVSQRENAVLVPEMAVVAEGDRPHVYVLEESEDQDSVRRVDVQIGTRLPGEVEIQEGLSEGDRVVTYGLQRLQDGATVRVVGTGDGPDAGS